MLNLDDDAHPLFSNVRINRKLTLDARRFFVDELVRGGGAEWLADDDAEMGGGSGSGSGARSTGTKWTGTTSDSGTKSSERRRCLVLWRSIPAWADVLYKWATERGYQGQVVTAGFKEKKSPRSPRREVSALFDTPKVRFLLFFI